MTKVISFPFLFEKEGNDSQTIRSCLQLQRSKFQHARSNFKMVTSDQQVEIARNYRSEKFDNAWLNFRMDTNSQIVEVAVSNHCRDLHIYHSAPTG